MGCYTPRGVRDASRDGHGVVAGRRRGSGLHGGPPGRLALAGGRRRERAGRRRWSARCGRRASGPLSARRGLRRRPVLQRDGAVRHGRRALRARHAAVRRDDRTVRRGPGPVRRLHPRRAVRRRGLVQRRRAMSGGILRARHAAVSGRVGQSALRRGGPSLHRVPGRRRLRRRRLLQRQGAVRRGGGRLCGWHPPLSGSRALQRDDGPLRAVHHGQRLRHATERLPAVALRGGPVRGRPTKRRFPVRRWPTLHLRRPVSGRRLRRSPGRVPDGGL